MHSIKRFLLTALALAFGIIPVFAGTLLLMDAGTGAPGGGGGGPTCDGSLQLMLCSATGSIVVHAP